MELAKLGFRLCRKRVRRLIREMGIWAIYPKPRLSENRENHSKYSYLLNNFKVEEPGKVWAAGITYIPMREGFMYLAATLDWYSRYVVSWKVSNSLSRGGWSQQLTDRYHRTGDSGYAIKSLALRC